MADLNPGLPPLGVVKVPAKATHARSHKRAVPVAEDSAPGICRICRGEGTPEEPLFYPCKCSGSIRDVHQECLMEWLSHSQKKYCELCKTSFRFTKFYNPNMPATLPWSVFFRQCVRYAVQHSLGWLRVLIATSFWVSWLPWLMRRGWSAMFWISQESWGGVPPRHIISGASGEVITLSSTELGTNVCPSSPLFAPNTTPAGSIDTMFSWWNTTSLTSLTFRLLIRVLGFPMPISGPWSTTDTDDASVYESQSLLSQVQFFRHMTRNISVNSSIITVVEGQIITVVAIVSFIVIILVRDYVVQQQPEIQGRNDFNDAVPVADPVVAPIAPEPVQNIPAPAHAPAADESDESDNERFPTGEQVAFHERLRNRPLRHRAPGPAPPGSNDELQTTLGADEAEYTGPRNMNQTPVGNWSNETPGPLGLDNRPLESETTSEKGSSEPELTPQSSNASVTDAFEQGVTQQEDKGKAPAVPLFSELDDETPTPSWMPPMDSASSRPRSVSDGPQVHANVNPLANNTWSFAGIPPVPASASSSQDRDEDTPETSTSPINGVFETTRSAFDMPLSDEQLGAETEPIPDDESTLGVNGSAVAEDNVTTPGPTLQEQAPRQANPRDHPANPASWLVDSAAAYMFEGIETEAITDDSDIDEDDDQWVDVPMEDPVAVGEVQNNLVRGALEEAVQNAADPDEVADLLDADAIDDLEDFEGIMELLGMRGPITNLFQNVIFCALLVQIALFACVFAPFNIGRISIWLVAKPVRIVRIAYEGLKVVQDTLFFIGGLGSWIVLNMLELLTQLWIGASLRLQIIAVRKASWYFFMGAATRVAHSLALDLPLAGSGVQHWSAASHAALFNIQDYVYSLFASLGNAVSALAGIRHPVAAFSAVSESLKLLLKHARPENLAVLFNPSAWPLDLGPVENLSISLELAYWSPGDIAWAIFAGYFTLFLFSALYINSGVRVTRGTSLEEWENGLIDSLHQASGILKVITVISIEMLVFPLYCGLLLDLAVLPLFADATIKSRLLFTYNNPWTSVFVHWFVGTGYMFHFALFVSMCRKIMRPGVLYFIRDPDDPEFHPVRDVLERNLVTQLRKILFSAFVYGTLVVVCLGGVVWTLNWTTSSILPIRYGTNEPMWEFPVDILFFNFLMPAAFKVFKPGDKLQSMYQYCFRKSARILRLTYFLFGERRIDEEGKLRLHADSPHQQDPAWRKFFLGVNRDKTKITPQDLASIVDGVNRTGKSSPTELTFLRYRKGKLVKSGEIIPDGRFVRAPASDRVKIPKGRPVFLEVDEKGKRTDGKPDEGLHASDQFQMVYLPPHLLTRIFLFILLIWSFAAITGVGLTIVPLMIGRKVFEVVIPPSVKTNDIYAFCIGLHIMCPIFSAAAGLRKWYKDARYQVFYARSMDSRLKQAKRYSVRYIMQGAKVLYAYAMVFGVFPLVLSAMVELYISLPVHTLRSPPTAASLGQKVGTSEGPSQHNIRIAELWTMGLFYLRIFTKLVRSFMANTRFATALRSVFRRGWLHPEVRVLTRAFVLPGLFFAAFAIIAPPVSVRIFEILNGVGEGVLSGEEAARRVIMYRRSYPVLLSLGLLVRYGITMRRGYKALKIKIRDDTYLMGERLQNYEGPATVTKPATKTTTRGAHR